MPHLLLRHRTWPLSRIVFDGLGLSSRIGSDLARVGRVQGQPILTHASSVSLGHIRQDQVIRYRKHSLPHTYLSHSLTSLLLSRSLFSDFSLFPCVSLFHVISFFSPRCLSSSLRSLPGSLNFFLSFPHLPLFSRFARQKNRHALTGRFVHGWVECAFTLLVSAAAFAQNQSA